MGFERLRHRAPVGTCDLARQRIVYSRMPAHAHTLGHVVRPVVACSEGSRRLVENVRGSQAPHYVALNTVCSCGSSTLQCLQVSLQQRLPLAVCGTARAPHAAHCILHCMEHSVSSICMLGSKPSVSSSRRMVVAVHLTLSACILLLKLLY
jgi:hypothetical protein